MLEVCCRTVVFSARIRSCWGDILQERWCVGGEGWCRYSLKILQCAPKKVQEKGLDLHFRSVNLHSPSWRNPVALGEGYRGLVCGCSCNFPAPWQQLVMANERLIFLCQDPKWDLPARGWDVTVAALVSEVWLLVQLAEWQSWSSVPLLLVAAVPWLEAASCPPGIGICCLCVHACIPAQGCWQISLTLSLNAHTVRF